MRTKLISALGLLTLLLSGCTSTGAENERSVISAGDWLQASPLLAQQIEDEVARLPWTHGFDRLESIRWFASVGEPAYEKLFELVQHERPDVAAAALAAMGATGDPRLVPEVRNIRFSEAAHGADLELERARTLLRLGDWEHIPVLLRGLSDERLYTRSLCVEALREATRENLGYDPRATEVQRQMAIGRWESWFLARQREGLIPKAR